VALYSYVFIRKSADSVNYDFLYLFIFKPSAMDATTIEGKHRQAIPAFASLSNVLYFMKVDHTLR
jgi:hypothetical protein